MLNLAKRVKTENKLAVAMDISRKKAVALMDLMIAKPWRFKSDKNKNYNN